MELIKSKTFLNLAKDYAGECQAQTRYKFIEYGARKQGYEALADLVDKVVYNEFNHARMFYTYIQSATNERIDNVEICSGYPFKEKWDLLENLKIAAEDEENEYKKIYPEHRKTAEAEGFTEIAQLYSNIIQVESCHHKLFTDLYNQMSSDSLYKKPKAVKWKCAVCGYEHTGTEAPTVCPLCHSQQGNFMLKVKSE